MGRPLRSSHTEYLLNRRRNAVLLVRQGHCPAIAAELFRRIPHDKWHSREGKHFYVIVIVTNGHDLFAGDASKIGPSLQRVTLRTSLVEHIHNRKVAHR